MGNAFVTGGSMGSVQMDYATIKYNFTGNIEWISRYDGPDNDIDEANDIVLDRFGNVYVTGQSYALGTSTAEFDYLTINYDSMGTELWTHRYNGTGDSQDYAYVMTTDSTGNVYVTGQSLGTGGYGDIVTIKYGVTGINEWTGHPGNDKTFNLRVSPNPFKQQAQIRFTIQDSRSTIRNSTVSIFDASGRLVKFLNPVSSIENQESEVFWNGTDQSNRQLPSGVYFVRINAGGHQETRPVLLVR
jgi:hypothetical protein